MKIVQLQFDDGPYSLWDSASAYAGPVSTHVELHDVYYLVTLKIEDFRWKEEEIFINDDEGQHRHEKAFERAKKRAQEIFEEFVKEYFIVK